MEELDARERSFGQPFHKIAGVVEVQADVFQSRAVDGGQRFGHPVYKRFDTNEASHRLRCCLRDQILAAAKADLELNFRNR